MVRQTGSLGQPWLNHKHHLTMTTNALYSRATETSVTSQHGVRPSGRHRWYGSVCVCHCLIARFQRGDQATRRSAGKSPPNAASVMTEQSAWLAPASASQFPAISRLYACRWLWPGHFLRGANCVRMHETRRRRVPCRTLVSVTNTNSSHCRNTEQR